MSKKYIIEIEEEPFVQRSALHGEDAVYRAVGFKSLVFDKNGLEKLTPFDAQRPSWWDEAFEAGRKAGLNQRKIINLWDEVTAEGGEARFVVTFIGPHCISGIDFSGKTYTYDLSEIDGATGDSFPELEAMFQRMKGA